MTWYYESFWVFPRNWQTWAKEYPHVELRWKLHVVRDRDDRKWKFVTGSYGIMGTRLDQHYLDERFDKWEDAVERAHDLVSTVATSHQGLTFPEVRARVEAETDRTLF